MLVDLHNRKLRPKPESQPKPLKPYVSKSYCVSVDKGRLSDEITDLLRCATKPLVHSVKIARRLWKAHRRLRRSK
jgi:hypothetical protein